MRIVAALAALLALGAAPAGAGAEEAAPIEVMVLGTYHFANPGADIANARIDSMTTPAKQAELAELAERLARFRPTLVAVEREAPDQATLLDPAYPGFTPAKLATDANERTQIGYRLAHLMGLKQVYAIDEGDRPGEPSYFPFEAVQAWAAAHGRTPELEGWIARMQGHTAWLEAAQRTRSVSQILAEINNGKGLDGPEAQAGYYAVMGYADAEAFPGADLNARWYARNARIFAKLTRVAKPGDRVLVLYGSGHNYWLRHFAATTPGFRLVEVGGYLGE